MTYFAVAIMIILGSALYAGMNTDKLFYRDPIYAYETNKGRILDSKKVDIYVGCTFGCSLAWPLVLIGAAVVVPLYGIFKLGQKISKRKEVK